MMSPTSTLRFVWWNLQSFAHYEPTRAGETRWPSGTPLTLLSVRIALLCYVTALTLRLVSSGDASQRLAPFFWTDSSFFIIQHLSFIICLSRCREYFHPGIKKQPALTMPNNNGPT
jgi:hypothetical protein